jgi:hypothetical protein
MGKNESEEPHAPLLLTRDSTLLYKFLELEC